MCTDARGCCNTVQRRARIARIRSAWSGRPERSVRRYAVERVERVEREERVERVDHRFCRRSAHRILCHSLVHTVRMRRC